MYVQSALPDVLFLNKKNTVSVVDVINVPKVGGTKTSCLGLLRKTLIKTFSSIWVWSFFWGGTLLRLWNLVAISKCCNKNCSDSLHFTEFHVTFLMITLNIYPLYYWKPIRNFSFCCLARFVCSSPAEKLGLAPLYDRP